MRAGRRRYNACTCCGRALTDPVSMERGIGPICEATAKERAFVEAKQLSFFHLAGQRAEFSYYDKDGIVSIHDLGMPGRLSVTNDIEHVLAKVSEFVRGLRGKLVIYEDTAGDWGGIRLTDDGRYAGFVSLRQRDRHQATLAMREWARGQR